MLRVTLFAGFILIVCLTKVHAGTIQIKDLKPVAAPTYTVNGKETNVADAMQTLLQGGKAYKCVEVELAATRSGVSIKPKKSN